MINFEVKTITGYIFTLAADDFALCGVGVKFYRKGRLYQYFPKVWGINQTMDT